MAIFIRNRVSVLDSFIYQPLGVEEFSKLIRMEPGWLTAPVTSGGNKTSTVTGLTRRAVNLMDTSTIEDVDGAPVGNPANEGWGWTEWDNYNIWDGGDGGSWYNYKLYTIILDLQDVYDLDYIYLFNSDRVVGFNCYSATEDEPAIYRPLFLNRKTSGANSAWVKYTFDVPENQSGCRYITIGFDYPDAGMTGMALYGRRRKQKPIQGIKFKNFTRHRPANHRIGTNAFYFEDAEMLASVSESTRMYIEPDWYMGVDMNSVGEGSKNSIEVDDIMLEFETNHMGNTDQLLQGYANLNMRILWDAVAQPAYLREWYTVWATQQCPVDPGLNSMDLTVTTNPLNYKHIARIWYIIAARYGNNPNVDTSMFSWGPGEVERKGMGVIHGVEIGNESDAGWNSEEGYMSAFEMAAFMSACYDGHMGQLGAGFGIKNADPSLLLSIPGLASNGDYIIELRKWWDTYRGKGNYPIDIINYHAYNTSSGGQIETSSNEPTRAVPPEMLAAGFDKDGIWQAKYWDDFRCREMPSAEIWNTETGYDEHWGGAASPLSTDQFTRSRFKAYWLTRVFLCEMMDGVDSINQYWFAFVGGPRFQDIDQSKPDPQLFYTMQLVDGYTDGSAFWGRQPLMSYWYVYHFKETVKNYYMQHDVVRAGHRRTKETIVNSTDPRIWAVAFTNHREGKSMIAIWLQGEGKDEILGGAKLADVGYQALDVTINVPETSVVVGTLDEAEIRQGDKCEESIKISALTGGTRRVTVTIGECPIFVYTSNIGTPAPIPVKDIKTERLTTGEMHIVWTDMNLDNFTVTVKRSTSLSGPYSTIHTSILPTPEYVDATAAQETDYYYQIELS